MILLLILNIQGFHRFPSSSFNACREDIKIGLINQHWATRQTNTNRTMVYAGWGFFLPPYFQSNLQFRISLELLMQKWCVPSNLLRLFFGTPFLCPWSLALLEIQRLSGALLVAKGKSTKSDPNCILQIVLHTILHWVASNFSYGALNDDMDDYSYKGQVPVPNSNTKFAILAALAVATLLGSRLPHQVLDLPSGAQRGYASETQVMMMMMMWMLLRMMLMTKMLNYFVDMAGFENRCVLL